MSDKKKGIVFELSRAAYYLSTCQHASGHQNTVTDAAVLIESLQKQAKQSHNAAIDAAIGVVNGYKYPETLLDSAIMRDILEALEQLKEGV